MPNYWDDPWAPSNNGDTDPSPSSNNYWEDPWGLDEEAPYRGLPTDEWNPNELQSEGNNSRSDNFISRWGNKAGAVGMEGGAGFVSSTLDLFDSVLNSEKWHTGGYFPEPSSTLKLQELSQEEKLDIQGDIEHGKKNSALGAASDMFSDLSEGAGEVSQSLSAKYDTGSILGDMKENFPSLNPFSWDPQEALQDTGRFGSDLTADLAGMAISAAPLVKGVKGAASLIKGATSAAGDKVGMGMALSVYGDTYSELTKNEEDSRLTAVVASGANAVVQGVAEKIGWDVAVGKTVFGQWFKDSVKASAMRALSARMLLASPTETSEEVIQEVTDSIAKRLPGLSTKGWDTVKAEIAQDARERVPEAAFGGFLGSFVLSGGSFTAERGSEWAMTKLGYKDIVARNGDLPRSPDDQIAGAIDSPISEDKAKDGLVTVIDSAAGGDLTGVFDKDRDGVMDGPVGAVDQILDAAKNANAAQDAADEAIKDVVKAQEADRATLGEGLTTLDIDAAGTRIQTSIEKAGQERGAKAGEVAAMAMNLLQWAQGGTATFDAGDTEATPQQGVQMQVTPQEMTAQILYKAAEVGVEVPQEALSNPAGFDWQGWTQTEVEKGKESARNGLSEPLQAIREAIEPEPDSPMAQVLSEVPAPSSAVVRPASLPPVDGESVASRVLGKMREMGRKKGANPTQPNVGQLLQSSKNNNLEWMRPHESFANESGVDPQGMIDAMESSNPNEVMALIKESMPDVSESAMKASGVEGFVAAYSDTMARITRLPEDAPLNVRQTLVAQAQGAVSAIEVAMSNQRIPGITTLPALVNQRPDIEGSNVLTRKVKATEEDANSPMNFGSRSMGQWLKDDVVPSVIAGGMSSNADQLRSDTATVVGREESAFQIAPQIKSMIFNVWQTGNTDLREKLGNALRDGFSKDQEGLATDVANHLASQGFFIDLPNILSTDPKSMHKFSVGLIGTGKGIMSPWAMERLLIATGTNPVVAKSAIAVMNAMSERWAMKNGKDIYEWWDRLGDYAKVQEFLEAPMMGRATSDKSSGSRDMWGIKYAQEYGKGMLQLFINNGQKMSPKVALHEVIHLLYINNLMYEMLDKAGRGAMETLAGEKLWDSDGISLDISAMAHEKMAVGFEVFIMENRAPNKMLEIVFNDIKEFFREHIKYFMDLLGVDIGDVPIYGDTDSPLHIKLKDLNLNHSQIRAFYQLLNARADGSEIIYNSPGIATAMEALLTESTGIPAKGVFTQRTSPASLITMPVFPKDRVVTADDLPDAADAANTKWFHGSAKESLHTTGLSSTFSKVGLVGTGVYLTDDPALAETYRKGPGGITIRKLGDRLPGEVYAVKAEPRKIVNLEKQIDPEAKSAIFSAIEKYIGSEYPDIEREDYTSGNSGRAKYKEIALKRISEVKAYIGWEMGRSAGGHQELQALTLIKDIMGAVGSDERLFKMIEESLRDSGYDAYTHIGGSTLGGKLHRVLVLLDPKSYSKNHPETVVGVWPTTQVNPETIEDDWSIHSGHGPSDSQWRRMVGLSNSESDGTHTHATLLAMQKEREYLDGLAKDVKEAPSMSARTAPSSKRVDAQKELLKAVSSGEVLKGEALTDAMMDQLMKITMSSGRDAYGSGDVVDPTNTEKVKDMLSNFMSKMRSWKYLASQGKIDKAVADMVKSGKYGVVSSLVWALKKYETNFGSSSASLERMLSDLADISDEERRRLMAEGGQEAVDRRIVEVNSLNMGSLAKALNNHYSLGKLADKVAEKIPQLWDGKLNKFINIPGARSFQQITTTFNQMADSYYEANKDKLPYVDKYEFHDAVTRDLRAWMYSARQFELIENVKMDLAKWEEAKRQWNLDVANALLEGKKHDAPEPPKPKVPHITEEGTKWAESAKMLMELRYGKNLAMFKATAQELVQWETHMVLDKLLSVNMISEKEYSDMVRKGKHHIPMYRVRQAIAKSGAVNPRLDDSVYKVLDYLKNDISHKSEDPINSMLRRAAGIEMLTMRQHAKNTIGQRILTDVKWWASDYADSPFQILSFKEEINKEEFEALQKSGEFVVTSTTKYKKDDQNNKRESGKHYYKHIPYKAEHVEEGLKRITSKAVLRGLNKEAAKEADAERARFEQTIFAFYPEPGKPMYVVISDPSLAKAFFYMNNSQAAWQNSLGGYIMNGIDSMAGADPNAEVSERFAYKVARGTATGLYGFNRFAKSAITSNLSFLYNAIFRDMTAVIRSRAGLRWRDIPTAVGDASALLFPSLMEIYPEKFQAARDASQGMATFSGLAATNLKGDLDAEVLFSLTRGRGDLMNKARAGSYEAISKLMWNDMKNFFAKEGLTTAPGQMWSEMKRGKNRGKHLLSLGMSPINMAIAGGQFVGTVMENTTRLAERRLMMSEDMGKYPTLMEHYDPALAINGKMLAGFTGTLHRKRWERAKNMLAKDPNYKVPEDSLPVQTNMTERDHAMNHITLNFAQRGRHTATLDQHIMFFNPMAQDFYTNIMILARHSVLQKAVAKALGNDWKAAKDQVRLDAAAHAWLVKSIFYITIPAIGMLAMYGGDDDDSKEWQAQSMIEKLSYNWLPTDKLGITENPIRVAQGMGLYSLFFKDMPMAFYLDATEKDPKAWGKYWQRFFDGTPFGMIGSPMMTAYEDGAIAGGLEFASRFPSPLALEAVDPVVELVSDREKFRDKAIAFPQALAREDPTEVQRERHNMFVNAVTKAFSWSRLQPAQIKYLIGRYTPGSTKWMPDVVNKTMESVAGVEGIPEDVQPSNSPIAGQSPGWLPRWQAKEAWGMGNQFVQDLLSTARDASEQMRSYEQMPESRKPVYLADHPLIKDDIYYGKRPDGGFRSGGLSEAAKKVIAWDKDKKAKLKAGDINETEAMLLERQYTLFAMEVMRNVVFQLGE